MKPTSDPSYAVEVEELTKRFGAIVAVDRLSLRAEAGRIHGLLGPNGSGKTTLIRMLMGLLKPTSGSMKLLGQDLPDRGILSQAGYMPQAEALYHDLTVRENMAFFGSLFGVSAGERIDELLRLVDLRERAGSLVRELSGGMRRRASLACVLMHSPRLLLLDEPTVGVDPQLRAQFWAFFRSLAAQGVTLIVSTHVMDEAEHCDNLFLLREGRLLAQGSASDIRSATGKPSLEEAFLHLAEARVQPA